MSLAAHQWIDHLADETLPVMRRSLTLVRDLLNRTNVNHPSLAETISRDPGFSLHIIRQFNKMPNAPEMQVGKISQAIPLLGMALVERASRTLPCLEDRLKGPPRRGLINCYSRAMHAAVYANALAVRRRDPEAGSIYTAALLNDIGEMALWSREPERMRQVTHLIQKGDGYDDAAQVIFGCTIHEIGAGLSETWRLPELVSISQGLANSYLPRPLTVMLAAALARESSQGWQRQQTLDGIELLAEFLNIPSDKAVAWFHGQAAEAARQLWKLSIPLPAFNLIHGGAQDRGMDMPRVPADDQAATPTAGKATPVTIEPPPAQAKTATDKPANPLQHLIATTLQEMRREHGLQRAMFAMLNREKTELRTRLVTEAAAERSLKGFSVDLTVPSLFSMLLRKPQAIVLNPSNTEHYLPLIPMPMQSVINPRQCLIMSVFLRNKPIGLFYADNGHKQGISPQQFANFKAACQRAIQALS